jgi:hypothetical protein
MSTSADVSPIAKKIVRGMKQPTSVGATERTKGLGGEIRAGDASTLAS